MITQPSGVLFCLSVYLWFLKSQLDEQFIGFCVIIVCNIYDVACIIILNLSAILEINCHFPPESNRYTKKKTSEEVQVGVYKDGG